MWLVPLNPKASAKGSREVDVDEASVEVFAGSDAKVHKGSMPRGNWCFLTPRHLP